MQDLENKVAVITGAGSGIGEGIARAASAAGMKIVVADIDIGKAQLVATDLVTGGGQAIAVKVDVSELASVEALRDTAVAEYGAVHLLCNNAGVWLGALMQDADIKDWQYLINVNLFGVVHGVKAFLPLLIAQGEGHIVNTASMGGLISGPPEGLYTTTKFAVVGLSEALLMEVVEQGVGVSVLCPGLVDTNLITQSFAVRPDSVNSGIDHQQPAPDVASGISPLVVGQQVMDAVREDGFYVITHDDYRDIIKMRHDGIIAALDASTARYGSTRAAPTS
ncbi:MAG: NAD(P)-dependent dehydrogenase (short-subunit alcohol dehydrogenase family) [Halioglobus sp.]|jgi:NAD(P)-dependent dehydrogenase (short-subunit alcohol dehydrogenase family)